MYKTQSVTSHQYVQFQVHCCKYTTIIPEYLSFMYHLILNHSNKRRPAGSQFTYLHIDSNMQCNNNDNNNNNEASGWFFENYTNTQTIQL